MGLSRIFIAVQTDFEKPLSGLAGRPSLLAVSHTKQRLAGSEEVRSCESQKQLKIHLAANSRFTTEEASILGSALVCVSPLVWEPLEPEEQHSDPSPAALI
ncbi:Hypothetical predicted protein [Xyrichtys novacula]|uniref:Uncharacterized protein n=1 Tax=Xyrichtys novacula TaxID=13765 RepID=A0AAV1FLP5_XYRNO|nr:Hypothetical predicted protein [Xyrichtys novacula]